MKPNRFMLALAALCFASGGASAQQTDGKSVAPKTYKAYMVSDAHLDTQWNWDVQTTIREYIPRTLFRTSTSWSASPTTASASKAASSIRG